MRPKSTLTPAEKKQKQWQYNHAFREKQRRIKELKAQLDAVVADLENQPKCEDCRQKQMDCRHNHVRSVLGLQADTIQHELAKLEARPEPKKKKAKA